ncbi:MAG: anti-sigma factor [Luteimonas sp.]
MSTPYDDIPDSDDLLAAEYLLGLLDADARSGAQARLQQDHAFAAQVAAWEDYFSPWLEGIAPVEVPAALWPRIRAALWQHELPARGSTPVARPSLWDRLPFWRGLAAGGFAVAAASMAALLVTVRSVPEPVAPPPPVPVVTMPTPAPPAAPMAVSLLHDDGSAAYNAVVNPDTGVIVLVPVHMPDDVRVPELWLIGDDGVPKSLGVIARDRAMQVRIPDSVRQAAEANAIFAVSLEPEGGSPTGQPTGPVVAKGNLIEL